MSQIFKSSLQRSVKVYIAFLYFSQIKNIATLRRSVRKFLISRNEWRKGTNHMNGPATANMDIKRKKCARVYTWWRTREHGRLRSKLNHTVSERGREDAKERDVEDRGAERKNERRGKGRYNKSAQAALTATVILIALTAILQRRDATRRDATILIS